MAISAFLVSIIVPCFNQSKYLTEALESVLAQTYLNWECFIVNDGSNDDTELIALEFVEKDDRFKYLKKNNGGLSSARNQGIKNSYGVYILPLDADDKIGFEYIEKAIQILDNDPNVKVVYSKAEFFGDIEGKWDLPLFTLKGLALSNMIFCSAMFKKLDYDLIGGYDETFLYGYEDWDLWLGILGKGGVAVQLPEVYFYYRKKKDSMLESLGKDQKRQIEIKNKIYLKHLGLYTKLFGDPISSFFDQACLKNTKTQLDDLYKSKSYRLGNFIISSLLLFKWKR